MTRKLKLGPLPDVSTVRMTITLPSVLKSQLDAYAQAFVEQHQTPVDVPTLVPIILTHFLAADKFFQRTIRRPTEH